MTRSEIYHTLEIGCWNKSWFSRKLYPGRNTTYFHQKLKWGTFTADEITRLRNILRELANTEI